MNEHDWLADRFEAHRGHLRAVAYRMLGSLTEADDAVQESWFRLERTDTSDVGNLGGWLTTVVARVCLDMLRSRTARREEPVGAHLPDPILARADTPDPENQAVLADSVGLALLVVLQTLGPAERLAFVLHDMFAIPFDDIAGIIGKTPAATRQLASRARRRVQTGAAVPDQDLTRQRQVVDAFLDASHNGDFAALVSLLDPDVVLHADTGTLREIHGAEPVARNSSMFHRLRTPDVEIRPALVNGNAGVVAIRKGHLQSVVGFTIVSGRIVQLDILADPARLAQLDVTVLED